MSRTPSAHWIPDSLSKRIPYTDTLKYDPYEISYGYGHQEINHLLGILVDPNSPKPNMIKSLRMLADLFTGREAESIQHHAMEVLKPFLLQPPNSLLLNALIALEKLVNVTDHAKLLAPDVPRIVEIIDPENEVPLRHAAASLLCKITEFAGPLDVFVEKDVPIKLVNAAATKNNNKDILEKMFYMLSRLTNVQNVRVPIISSPELLKVLVNSINDPQLQDSAMSLASNIAMDKSHRGKSALLEANILSQLGPQLDSEIVEKRMSALSLISLLAVPKDGKELLTTVPEINVGEVLLRISEKDPDLHCRRAAMKCRIFIAESPFGKIIVGNVVDPSIPVPKPLPGQEETKKPTEEKKPEEKVEEPKVEVRDPSKPIPRSTLAAELLSLLFLACAHYKRITGRQLSIKHSLHDGVFCADTEDDFEIDAGKVKELEDEVRSGLQQALPFQIVHMQRDELIKHFVQLNDQPKLNILKTIDAARIACMKCGDYLDYIISPVSDTVPADKVFELHPYAGGFVLRAPTISSQTELIPWEEPVTQHKMFDEYLQQAHSIGIRYIGDLNHIIVTRKIEELKWTCEGLHKKKLAQIANTLVENFDKKKVISIAGPSSSNKTTFAKLLQINLKVLGYNALVVELDDYVRNREDTPFGPDGLRDFESLTATNVELFGERMRKLLAGQTIPRRKFDFKSGIGFDVETETQKLEEKTFIIFEGIHGLNPAILDVIGRDQVNTIYVAPLTPLAIDETHRFPTTDLRLIRRIIRDHKYRGYSARQTIRRWTSVRVGEEKNIFPFQENADLFFNSSLLYELPIYSIFGRGLLAEATVPAEDEDPNDENTRIVTNESRRLLVLLNMFYAIDAEEVPRASCIREFIGGSDLKY